MLSYIWGSYLFYHYFYGLCAQDIEFLLIAVEDTEDIPVEDTDTVMATKTDTVASSEKKCGCRNAVVVIGFRVG